MEVEEAAAPRSARVPPTGSPDPSNPDRNIDRLHVLSYAEPAQAFTEALPLGNGRLGAMCFGGSGEDLIRLNDGTAWSGSPASELAVPPQDAARNADDLRQARQLIRGGQYAAAERRLERLAQPYTQAYLPFADLVITAGDGRGTHDAGSYRRTLDLRTGTHTHSYRRQGSSVTQRVLVSAVHGVLTLELEAEQPIDLAVDLRSRLRILRRISAVPGVRADSRAGQDSGAGRDSGSGRDSDSGRDSGSGLRLAGELGLQLQLPSDVAPHHSGPGAGITYGGPSLAGAVVLAWEHDGEAVGGEPRGVESAAGSGLRAEGVRRARLFLATDTTYTTIGAEPRGTAADAYAAAADRVRKAQAAGIDAVRSGHLAEHHRLYSRAALTLGPRASAASGPSAPDLSAAVPVPVPDVPTLIGTPQAAPQLAALLFNYGRYLLLSSSRPGSLPATLQGLWNEDMQPPWSSNYTLNINTEMNYWGAEAANLSECSEPLVDLVAALARKGTATAARTYGLQGWVAHHNTDAWAFTSPAAGDAAWSFWPLGAAWLSTQLAEQLRFGGSARGAAAARAWPIIRSACRFYLGWLQQMPDGSLGTIPSTSPENHFHTAEGPAAAAASSTADITIIRQLFRDAQEFGPAGDAVVEETAAALRRLPPIPLTASGLVSEWAEDFRLPEPEHRHLSHLWFAYPGRDHLDAPLADAVSRSLDGRGDDSTGWSLVWKMALRARLGDGDAVGRLLSLLLRSAEQAGEGRQWAGGLYRNLFAAHPPFQIDGNLGFVAAVAECLIQSRRSPGQPGTILLLPALPPQWRSGGSVHGLVVVPGLLADLEWEENDGGAPVLVRAVLRARTEQAAGRFLLVWNGAEHFVDIGVEQPAVVSSSDFQVSSPPAGS